MDFVRITRLPIFEKGYFLLKIGQELSEFHSLLALSDQNAAQSQAEPVR